MLGAKSEVKAYDDQNFVIVDEELHESGFRLGDCDGVARFRGDLPVGLSRVCSGSAGDLAREGPELLPGPEGSERGGSSGDCCTHLGLRARVRRRAPQTQHAARGARTRVLIAEWAVCRRVLQMRVCVRVYMRQRKRLRMVRFRQRRLAAVDGERMRVGRRRRERVAHGARGGHLSAGGRDGGALLVGARGEAVGAAERVVEHVGRELLQHAAACGLWLAEQVGRHDERHVLQAHPVRGPVLNHSVEQVEQREQNAPVHVRQQQKKVVQHLFTYVLYFVLVRV